MYFFLQIYFVYSKKENQVDERINRTCFLRQKKLEVTELFQAEYNQSNINTIELLNLKKT